MRVKDLSEEDWGKLEAGLLSIKPLVTSTTMRQFYSIRDHIKYHPSSTPPILKLRMNSALEVDFKDIPLRMGKDRPVIYDVVYKFRLEKGE